MTKVSIQEIRFEFKKVKKALDRGEEMLLTFRNRPLARLTPVASARPALAEDPALHFAEGAEDLPPLDNRGIDSALYG
jgi:antitoxin (DNA-binding transcriptional repressor) of toxin-antitoxin stability system